MSGNDGTKGSIKSEADDEGGKITGSKHSLDEKPNVSEFSGDEEAGEEDMDEFNLDPEKRKEVRKMRRVMANRRSARESRERRKKLLTDLQESVESLSTENADLAKENMALRQELATLIEQSGGAASLGMPPNTQAL